MRWCSDPVILDCTSQVEFVKTLNEVYSSLRSRRRYEVWFLRLGLADGSGAWWFRYLLLNPGRSGCTNLAASPVQVWATWFPRDGKPQSFIQGFSLNNLDLSARGRSPFHFRNGWNQIAEDSCRGNLALDDHTISWDLRYRSTFRSTLSNKGWIGFSRSPHSDATFSGRVTFDGRSSEGDPLGFGVQGHNCGYRHRGFWRWGHAYFPQPNGKASTFEGLVYDMPFGMVFRKAVLWHDGKQYVFRKVKEIAAGDQDLQWKFQCSSKRGLELEAFFDKTGPSIHRVSYVKTDCSGSFEVRNNSLAKATLSFKRGSEVQLSTDIGAVLEMAGTN
jgi:hypothetical protein